ncbi:MAG: ATP-binding cassette domain-containing protein, partial [Alphaproteobacteria bacterium]|nr:ATP-binding cassette domain-containing protein [Alphaproteobacteria bacterium]
MALFEGTDLACERGGRTVFSGLRFGAAAGGVLLLAGANGSGKSSLLRLMAGLAQPAAGTMSWAGTVIADDPDGHR